MRNTRTWWQMGLLALVLLVLMPCSIYQSGMLWYANVSNDGMTKAITELWTYLSIIVILSLHGTAMVIRAVREKKRRKEAQKAAQKEMAV